MEHKLRNTDRWSTRNTDNQSDQTIPSFIEYRTSQLVLIRLKPMNKSSTAESKEKGKNEDEKQDDKEEATTETKTPGKRKILPSTGQETSYLAFWSNS